MRVASTLVLACVTALVMGCGASSPAPRVGSAVPMHRPERVRGVGAQGLASPSEPRRAERIAAVPIAAVPIAAVPITEEEPIAPGRLAEELNAGAPDVTPSAVDDLSRVDLPPPPAAGTYVVPERVEAEEGVAVTSAVPPARPPPRRRSFQRSLRMGDPVFSSPSIFAPSGPSSGVSLPEAAE